MKLLNIDANAKTVKGQTRGYMTAVLYLAPWKAAGVNVCPMAEIAGCHFGCLNTAGRGGIAKGNATMAPYGVDVPDNAIQRARIARTRFYAEDRAGFLAQLVKEILAFERKAARKGLVPVVRLNGTSDIQYEIGHPVTVYGQPFANIFEAFPTLQFYDYTKIAKRFGRELPGNYHLSLSYSEASERYRDLCRDARKRFNATFVAVVRDEATKARYMGANNAAVDGDEHDLRFLDPRGSLVLLKAKGSARRDTSGFVLD